MNAAFPDHQEDAGGGDAGQRRGDQQRQLETSRPVARPGQEPAEAGADCLYAPWITSLDHVSAIVAAVSPKPVNLIIHTPFTTVAEAARLGVRRISVGGMLAKTAWRGFLEAAREIAQRGTFSQFVDLPNLNALLDPS